MTGTLAVLRAARDLLTPPGAWIQDRYANADWTCFCLVGALGMVDRGEPMDPSGSVMDALLSTGEIAPFWTVSDWNDASERTQADVLALLDQAIAAQTASEGAS